MTESKEPITISALDTFYRIHNFTISQTGIDMINKAIKERDMETVIPFLEALVAAAVKNGPIN